MNKKLKWLFIVLFAFFSIGVVAGSIFVYRFDMNTYKPQIEKIVFEQTGRKLSLGDIRLKISWVPMLNIKRISFANADQSAKKNMIEAKEAEISVAIIPLFDKVIAIDDIKLIQPKIYLSVNEKGGKNWVFEKPASETEKKTPETGNGFMSDMKLTIKKVSVSDGVIIYDSPKSKINLQIKRVSLKPEESHIFLDYDLLYNGREVKGTMKGDAIDALMRNNPYNAEIDVGALNCRLKTSIVVTDISGDWQVEGKLDLTSPEGNFNLPALQLKSNVSADQKGVSLGIEQLEFGKSIITGDVVVSLTEKPDIRANIVAPLIDVPSLTPDGKASAATAKTRNSTEEKKILLDFLTQFNAHLAFFVERLNVNEDFSFDQIKGTAVVKGGVLTLKPLSGKMENGTLNGSAVLNSKGNIVKVETDFRNVILNDFLKEVLIKKGFVFNNVSAARLNGTFSTKGKTYGDLLENLKASLQIDKLNFNQNSVGGRADISFKNKLNIKGKLTASSLDIPSLLPAKEDSGEKNSSIPDASKDDFIPKGDLRLDFLDQFDTHFDFDISHLVVNRDLSLDKLKGTVEVKDGILKVKEVSFVAGKGTVKTDLFLNARNNTVNINMDGADIVLPDLIKSLKPEDKKFSFKKGGVAYARVALKTKGKSYRNLFENLDGQVLLTVGQSEVQFESLKYIQGNFLMQLMSALNISNKQTDANLKCAVIRADFTKGKVQFPKGIAFDSDQIKLVGNGSLSLADKKLDILIQPLSGNLMQTNATQILASMIKVTGTVMNPSVSVNSKSVIKNAVGIAAGGAVFVGAKLLLDSDADPCRTALQGTAYDKMYRETAGIKAGMQRMYQKTSDTLESAAESVIDTAKKGMDTVNKTTNRFLNWFGNNE